MSDEKTAEDWDVSYTAGCLTFSRRAEGVILGPSDVMDERDAIVRELADRGPFVDVDTFGDAMGNACADLECQARDGDLNNPDHHDPTCLWRRARALYPKAVSNADAT